MLRLIISRNADLIHIHYHRRRKVVGVRIVRNAAGATDSANDVGATDVNATGRESRVEPDHRWRRR